MYSSFSETFFRLNRWAGFVCSVLVFMLFLSLGLSAEEAVQKERPHESRNPMLPVNMSLFEATAPKVAAKRQPFKVQGFGKSEKGTYVIIGGNVFREGDSKGEIKVVKIGEAKVDILVNGEPDSLPMK